MCVVCETIGLIAIVVLVLMFIAGVILTYYGYYFIGLAILIYLARFVILWRMDIAEAEKKSNELKKQFEKVNQNYLEVNGY